MSRSPDKGRRRFLGRFARLAGGSAVILASGLGWRAYDNGVFSTGRGSAYEPWRRWQDSASLPLIRAAILAGSPHNTQPWLFAVSPARIEVYADTRRYLGSLDPFMREMHMGLGCALENILIAARAGGRHGRAELVPGRLTDIRPGPEPQLVARVEFTPAAPRSSVLYQAIPRRHTNRGAYDPEQPVAVDLLRELTALVEAEGMGLHLFPQESPLRRLFNEAMEEATEAIVSDPEMVADSSRWFRTNPDEIAAHRDGLNVDVTGLPGYLRVIAKILPPPSPQTAHEYWLDYTRKALETDPVTGLITVPDLYDRPLALRSGQLLQRIHLWATARGLSMAVTNQLPEMVDRERQTGAAARTDAVLGALLGGRDARKATLAFRLGYGMLEGLPSPRRPADSVLIRPVVT